MRMGKRFEEIEKLLANSVPRASHDQIIAELKDIINELKAQNTELFQRLMARDLPELQTFSVDESFNPGTYNLEVDEELAGEIIDET